VNTRTKNRRRYLVEKAKNKTFRDALVSEAIDAGLPFQIRAMREAKEWTQHKLGKLTGIGQTGVSRIEDPSYGKMTLSTLKTLASAFDVALLVRFVPFSQLMDLNSTDPKEGLAPPSYDDDPAAHAVFDEDHITVRWVEHPGPFASSLTNYVTTARLYGSVIETLTPGSDTAALLAMVKHEQYATVRN